MERFLGLYESTRLGKEGKTNLYGINKMKMQRSGFEKKPTTSTNVESNDMAQTTRDKLFVTRKKNYKLVLCRNFEESECLISR